MKPVAFFDIDGTVFRSSLLIELVNQLIKEEIFPQSANEVFIDKHHGWLTRQGTYDEYIGAVVEAFLQNIKGVHYGDFADVGRRVVATQSKHVYRYTRDLIKTLKKEGFYLVAISQSPKTILDEFCAQYGFDKVYGRIYEIGPQDKFTGAVSEEHLINNKANILKRIIDRHPEFSLKDSIAVGDTEGDITLLEQVSRPICFNPNKLLFEYAKRNDWEIVVERKDVIYHLD
jgi:HAD superfamily hydrolase (TIGR01490 family)